MAFSFEGFTLGTLKDWAHPDGNHIYPNMTTPQSPPPTHTLHTRIPNHSGDGPGKSYLFQYFQNFVPMYLLQPLSFTLTVQFVWQNSSSSVRNMRLKFVVSTRGRIQRDKWAMALPKGSESSIWLPKEFFNNKEHYSIFCFIFTYLLNKVAEIRGEIRI